MIIKQFTDKYYLQIVADIIGEELGLYYPENRLEELLRGIERTSELSKGEFSTSTIIENIVKAKTIPQYLYSLLSTSLTINETYFFRELPAIELFKTVIIREIEKSEGNYKIWSAGCSSGEEPYTLAIIIKEMLPAHIAQNIKIIATDISSKALNKAKEGLYTAWSFRETPKAIKKKYFKAKEGKWLISQEVKKMVSFSHLNLISESYPSSTKGADNFNLIFCRNVLMYFSHTNIRLVTSKLYNSLCEGGWLVTSQVELNNNFFSNFTKENLCNGFFYKRENPITAQKKGSDQKNREEREESRFTQRKKAVPRNKKVTSRNNVNPYSLPKVLDVTSSKYSDKPSLEEAWSLANKGEYEKALSILEELSNKNALETDYFYLYATILLEKGEFEKAAEYYKKCIYLDPSHILANYLLANIYLDLDKKELSIKYFRTALDEARKIDPTEEIIHSGGMSAKRIVEMLENIVEKQ